MTIPTTETRSFTPGGSFCQCPLEKMGMLLADGLADRGMRSSAYSLDGINKLWQVGHMAWDVMFDPVFAAEAKTFARDVQLEIAALAGLLQQFGPQLRRPHCDTLNGSRHPNMKELRFTLPDGGWRVAFAFEPERSAILLVGGSKSGMSEKRFYKDLIRAADARFTAHLKAQSSKDGGRR